MTEIKECPFCGGDAVIRANIITRGFVQVICEICNISTPEYSLAALAIRSWNRRKKDAQG